ncbi:amino acid ABC transporter permease [Spelaeicoccus albus]|uniref:Polar amino acid transport system permease protein n=1 Tax=Spelaeicoccus albus TaxID=1280376 RepID=A0A7Z0D526_9MICO|nr:amino acid ABC transporter permease [Spelaeicoccus albus]NYI69044.1 polar amino acid transport system permease protein [Spelaeicoccus albus]
MTWISDVPAWTAQYLPALLRGLGYTVIAVVISGIVGSLVGMVLGLAATSPLPPARWISNIYTSIIRGIPPLIILFFMFFALPILFPLLTFSPAFTAILGLSIYAAAYVGEIFRGSINAIPQGQSEAAEALGMGYFVKFRYVIVPQAMRIVLPSGMGFLISLVKASALASAIQYAELTKEANIISTINNQPLVVFLVAAALYFVISYPMALLGRWWERKLA